MSHYLQIRAVHRPKAAVHRPKAKRRRKVLLRIALAILLASAVVVTSGQRIKQWQANFYADRAMESVRQGRLDAAREQIDAATALSANDPDVLRVQTYVYSLRNERIAPDLWDELAARLALTLEERHERERLRRYLMAAGTSWIPADSSR